MKHRERLEDQVVERTAELTKINEQLKKEINSTNGPRGALEKLITA